MKRIKKEQVVEDEEQLELGLKEPLKNRFLSLRQKAFKKLWIMETKRFIRSGSVWALLILSGSLVAVQLYYIFQYQDTLPTIIPMFKHYTNLQLRLTRSENVYLIPAVSILILFTAIVSGYRSYNRKPTLSMFNLLSGFFALIMLTISLIKIFAIYNA